MIRLFAMYAVLILNLFFWIWLVWVLLSASRNGSLSMGAGALIFLGFATQVLFFGIQSILTEDGRHKIIIFAFLFTPVLFLFLTILLART